MNPPPAHSSKSQAILLIIALSVVLSASCKRIQVQAPVEQSSVPAGGSTTPAPCSVSSNGNYVNDAGEVLDTESENRLEQKLDALKAAGSIDFTVVTVKTTKEQAIAGYSLELARCWNVGGNNPDKSGLLLLLAVDDRKWHMQISRSIERVLSNDEIQRAASLMTPHLRDGNYSEGIDKCVDATIRTLAARRNFSITTSIQ